MLHLLSDWLKQIIIVIFIAVFLDLILPGNAFEKYVRVVMGLIILLTILSPITSFLKLDWQHYDLTSASVVQSQANMPDVKHVLAEGQNIQASYTKKELELVASQAGERLKKQLAEISDIPIVNAAVKLERAADGSIIIQSVQVQTGSSNQQTSPVSVPVTSITPVQPVRIQISAEANGEKKTSQQTPEQTGWTEMQEKLRKNVLKLLKQDWGLQPQHVQITSIGQ